MTQTNTDYLLQITPAADRAYGAAGANDDAGGFDNHLSQATTLSGGDSRNRSSGSKRTDTSRDERDEPQWNTGDFKSTSHNADSTTTSQTPPSEQEESTDKASGSTPTIEDTKDDEHDSEKADDTVAAEVAGVSQAAKNTSPKSNSKPEPNAEANRPGAAKAAALGKKTGTETGGRKELSEADVQATNSASSNDAANRQADEATDAVETKREADETQVTDSESQHSKAAKREHAPAKLDKGPNESSDRVLSNDASAEGSASGETSPNAAQKAIAGAEASATQAASPATKGKSETDQSSDDDSRTHSQNDTRADARNVGSVQTTKVDTAQLAVSTASATDAGANTGSKGKDNEQATKPITAKGEPAAAAFARMARNNITGSKESASGADDLPPIDPSRFIGRVAKAFQTAQDRGGALQLRLSPPELGALRIELNVKDGVMSAALQTENANARRLLLDHLPALRDRLAEQNIRVDRFDVDVRREGTSSQSDARGSQQQQFQHEPDQPAPRRQLQPQPQAREAAAPEKIAIGPSTSVTGLNLIV
jgi:flagellar hook-length control protein FliK